MRSKNVLNAAVTDLGTVDPFARGSTVVVLNTATAANTLQESDSASGPFTTIPGAAAVPAGQSVDVVISKRYVAIEDGSGTFVLLQQ